MAISKARVDEDESEARFGGNNVSEDRWSHKRQTE